jgi:hypothetical protein
MRNAGFRANPPPSIIIYVRLYSNSREIRPFLNDRLPLQFGTEVVDILCENGLHGYPSDDEYPISFPIVSVWYLDYDNYDLFKQDGTASDSAILRLEKKRRRYASKDAEVCPF